MRKFIFLIILAGIVLYGINFIKTSMPFMPVQGMSMEPVLHGGDLLFIKSVAPNEIEVGDIVVYNVPAAIQEYYRYPPVVAHRVIKINYVGGNVVSFRTKGDNTGEEPFTILVSDLRGKVGDTYPMLGFPLLFLQSRWGIIFTVTFVSLIALFAYGGEIGRGRWWLQREVFAPVIDETRRTGQALEWRMRSTEEITASTQQSLERFASAIGEYAHHLQSHTSAIIGLSEASHELKNGAAEQNRVLGRIAEVMEQPRATREEPGPGEEEVLHKLERVEAAVNKLEKVERVERVERAVPGRPQEVIIRIEEPGRRARGEHPVVTRVERVSPEVRKVVPKVTKSLYPPGCSRSRR